VASTPDPERAARLAARSEDVECLIAALDDPAWRVRDIAASSLGRLGDARAVEPLLAHLDTPSYRHAVLVFHALGDIGDTRAIAPLHDLAIDSRKPGLLRVKAISTLGRLGDRRAVDLACGALLDPLTLYAAPLRSSWDRATKRWAARELVRLHGLEALPSLDVALTTVGFRDRRRIRRLIRQLEPGLVVERQDT
jgi:HEAT repeat protein